MNPSQFIIIMNTTITIQQLATRLNLSLSELEAWCVDVENRMVK